MAADTATASYDLLRRIVADDPRVVTWLTDCGLRVRCAAGTMLSSPEYRFPDLASGPQLEDCFSAEGQAAQLIAAHRDTLQGTTTSCDFEWAGQTFRAHVAPHRNEQGQIDGCLAFARRVSDRGQPEAEVALQAAEQRYDQLLSAVTTYRYKVRLKDGQPTATEHSDGCLAATGYTPEEYRQDPFLWIKIVHPDDWQRVQQHVERVLNGQDVPPIEHRILHKNGKARWIRDTIICHRDEQGVLQHYDGLVEDVTERKQLEQRSWRILESAPDAMLVVNQEGKITLVNTQAENLFGFSRQELLDQSIEILIPEEFRRSHTTRRSEYMSAPQLRLMNERAELVAQRKDGSQFPAEIGLSPLQTDSGVWVCAAIRDITRRKQTEEALRSSLQIQSTLNALLDLSLQPGSLQERLERALNLLCDISWLRATSQGAVFIAEEGSDVLRIVTQRQLPAAVLAECQKIPQANCLCNDAAISRKIIFSKSLSPLATDSCAESCSQPHYCVPIVSESNLLGLFTVFVAEDHEENTENEWFLSAVANILAGMIERERTEASLRSSEERFQLAVQGTDAGIWDWDLLTNEVHFSPRWKSMLGWQEDEVKNHYEEWECRLHPEDRARALQTIRDYLEGKTPEYELEHRLRHKDGSYRWILARGAVVRDPQGQVYRMVGSHLDITARKRSEQMLFERDSQLIAAQRIQEYMLPHEAPKIPGFDIAGSLIAAEYAAGDYFDYLSMRDGSLLVVIGDVAGHGFSSALGMAMTSAHLRSFVEYHSDIQEILTRTNGIMCKETEETRFVTLFLLRLDPASQSFGYVNAGHPTGYWLDASGNTKAALRSTSMPLAVMPDTEFPACPPANLAPGDLVLLITDGIPEARARTEHSLASTECSRSSGRISHALRLKSSPNSSRQSAISQNADNRKTTSRASSSEFSPAAESSADRLQLFHHPARDTARHQPHQQGAQPISEASDHHGPPSAETSIAQPSHLGRGHHAVPEEQRIPHPRIAYQLRRRRARTEAGCRHSTAGQLLMERLRERQHIGLGGVIHRQVGPRLKCGRGGDVQDATTLPLDHPAHEQTGQLGQRGDIDLNHAQLPRQR